MLNQYKYTRVICSEDIYNNGEKIFTKGEWCVSKRSHHEKYFHVYKEVRELSHLFHVGRYKEFFYTKEEYREREINKVIDK